MWNSPFSLFLETLEYIFAQTGQWILSSMIYIGSSLGRDHSMLKYEEQHRTISLTDRVVKAIFFFPFCSATIHRISLSSAAEKHMTYQKTSLIPFVLYRHSATRGQHSSLCVVWMVSLSSPPTLRMPLAHASSDRWPAKVTYLSLSPIYSSTRTRARTQKHTAHIDLQ